LFLCASVPADLTEVARAALGKLPVSFELETA